MGAASATRIPPPTRWRSTSANASVNPFKQPSRTRGWRSDGDRCGERYRKRRCRGTRAPVPPWGGSTRLRAIPPGLRLVCWCRPVSFGDPKGGILRVPSAMGFKPAVRDDGGRSRLPSFSVASWAANAARTRIGGSTTNAVEDDPEVSAGDVQTRVSQRCFGGSMLLTLKDRSTESQTVGNTLLSNNVQRCSIA